MIFKKFSKRSQVTFTLVILSVLILGSVGYVWCQDVYSKPENVFNRMLSNSLSTASFTKQIVEESEAGKSVQSTRIFTAPDVRIHNVVELTQGGSQSSYVKRETLTSDTNNYVRLVTIKTEQKTPSGKPFDFSSILGVWGQTPAVEGDNSVAQLYNQNIAVPFANLSYVNKKMVLKQIRRDNVYDIDYSKVKTAIYNGRKAYSYEVGVKPVAFINMMKTVAKFVGVGGLDNVDSESYSKLPVVKFTFVIDVMSGDLVNQDDGNGQPQAISGIGVRSKALDPKNAITVSELQQRLQAISQ